MIDYLPQKSNSDSFLDSAALQADLLAEEKARKRFVRFSGILSSPGHGRP
jgi:hypothetical protein